MNRFDEPPPRPVTDLGGWQGWAPDAPAPAIAPFKAEQAIKHPQAWADYLNVPREYDNSIGMKLRLIPPGEQRDRDLKFFDTVLQRVKRQYHMDYQRIHATGFSNGGAFVFALWAARGDELAATAPCAAVAGANRKALRAKPCIHLAGEKDKVASFEAQEKSMQFVRHLNGCDNQGQPWNKAGARIVATLYQSSSGTPFVSVVCPVGHEVPQAAGRLITRFFKEHKQPEISAAPAEDRSDISTP